MQKRWKAIRRAFTNAINKKREYYLQEYLQFLLPHVKPQVCKKAQENVRKPYVPLKLSPVHLTSSDDDEPPIQKNNKESGKKLWIPELDLNGKNDGLAHEAYDGPSTSSANQKNKTQASNYVNDGLAHEAYDGPSTSSANQQNKTQASNYVNDGLAHEAYDGPSTFSANQQYKTQASNDVNDDNIWNFILETKLLNDYKEDFSKISDCNQLQCMSDIFQAIYFYAYL